MKSRTWLAIALFALTAVSVVLWHNRLGQDFWPIDAGRVSPNLLASLIQWAIILIAASLLYPPFRRAVDKWLRVHLHEHRQAMDDHLADLHKKLDHIIHHSTDIPDLPEKED